VLDADLAIEAVLLEERRAESAAGEAQRDLVVRPAGRSDHRLGDLVERHPGLAERRRQRLEPFPGAEPALGAPGREIRLVTGDLVPGQVAAIVDRGGQLASLRDLTRVDR